MKRFINYRNYAILALLSLFFTAAYAQDAKQLLLDGNEQYAKGSYQEAVTNYEKVIKDGYESAALYYNLANAQYKLNRTAPSVYYYEKALQLKPGDKDVKNNLTFAQNMTLDAITPLPQNTFKKWNNSVLGLFTTDGWAIMTVVLIFAFVLTFIFYYYTVSSGLKRLLFTVSFAALAVAIISLAIGFQSASHAKNNIQAIVWSAEAQVKSEPNLRSDEAFVLHEGTKVRVLEETDEWKHIRIADGKEGWITTTDIKEL
ncbi:MAG: tetratricopeptide repeat protein [Leeuwenhoekiella sp.]